MTWNHGLSCCRVRSSVKSAAGLQRQAANANKQRDDTARSQPATGPVVDATEETQPPRAAQPGGLHATWRVSSYYSSSDITIGAARSPPIDNFGSHKVNPAVGFVLVYSTDATIAVVLGCEKCVAVQQNVRDREKIITDFLPPVETLSPQYTPTSRSLYSSRSSSILP